MRIPAGIVNEKMTSVVPEPKRPTGGAFSVYEHDTWIFTVARLAQNESPGDLATMIRMATQFAPPALLRALKRGEPLGDVAVFRYPGGAWRRYDQMQRFPAGLLVFGDAICSTNPIYGQGMTVAALEATALQECLAEANGNLGQRFFAAAGEVIGPLWASNQFNDLYMANADPAHSASKELLDFREAVLSAAWGHPGAGRKTLPIDESRRPTDRLQPASYLGPWPDLAAVALGDLGVAVLQTIAVQRLGTGDGLFGGQRRIGDRGRAGDVDFLETGHDWRRHLGDLAGQLDCPGQ
jgi:hypothetical protein